MMIGFDPFTENPYHAKEYLRKFTKRMLKTQLFIGSFQEKRFVESLGSYRDVVKIDSDEKEFIENVLAVKRKIKQELPHSDLNPFEPMWVGITDPSVIGAPVGYNLWVILPVEVFGKYWFKVKTVEFLQNEVRLKLEIVRSLAIEKSYSDTSDFESTQDFNVKTTIQNLSNNVKENVMHFCKDHVTVSNMKESVIFIALLIGTLIAGSFNIIHYLMEYLLKLMKEISSLIQVSTPIFLSMINLVGRSIYGLYGLIVALFHDKPVQAPVYNAYYNVIPKNMIAYGDPRERYNTYFRHSRQLPQRSVTITPLDD